MDELTTSIVVIDFSNEDASKSNMRMECMLCPPGDLVELRLEPKNPFDEHAVAAALTGSSKLSELANIPPTTYQGPSHRQHRLWEVADYRLLSFYPAAARSVRSSAAYR